MSKELKTKLSKVSDLWRGIERNPDVVAAFSGHLSDCTRKEPLQIQKEIKMVGMPVITSQHAHFRTTALITTCLECGGSKKQQL